MKLDDGAPSPTSELTPAAAHAGRERDSLLAPLVSRDDRAKNPETVSPLERIVTRAWRARVPLVFSLLTAAFCVAAGIAGLGSGAAEQHVSNVTAPDLHRWALASATCDAGGVPTQMMSGPDSASTQLVCTEAALTWKSWLTVGITVIALIAMASNAPPDVTLLASTVILRVFSIITSEQAWGGFASPGVIAVGVLFIVAAAVQNVGTVDIIMRGMLGTPRSPHVALLRLLVPVAVFSAFLNNTPIVAMLIPVVNTWAGRMQQHPGIFLMPMSFASMLGGVTTMLGTSTNLIIQTMVAKRPSVEPLTMFSIAPLAVPIAVIGVLCMAVIAPCILKKAAPEEVEGEGEGEGTSKSGRPPQRRVPHFMVVFRVTDDSDLVGTPAEDTQVWTMPGVELVAMVRRDVEGAYPGEHVVRFGKTSDAAAGVVDGSVVLQAGDDLTMECTAAGVAALRHVRGVAIVNDAIHLLGAGRRHRRLVEAVVGWQCPMVGQTLPLNGPTWVDQYNAVPVSVLQLARFPMPSLRRRSRSRDAPAGPYNPPPGPEGNAAAAPTSLRVGDVLLLEAYPAFVSHHHANGEFLLAREVESSAPPRHGGCMDYFRLVLSGVVVLAMVSVTAVGWLTLVESSLLATAVLVTTKCITVGEAFRAVNARVLLAIVAAFGLGSAMEETGVAEFIARAMLSFGRIFGVHGTLFCIGIVTSTLGAVVSNNATAILMFPIVFKAYSSSGGSISFLAAISTLLVSASLSFATAISYQTNLMVLHPGSYSFGDFSRLGIPLQLALVCVTTALAPLVFPA